MSIEVLLYIDIKKWIAAHVNKMHSYLSGINQTLSILITSHTKTYKRISTCPVTREKMLQYNMFCFQMTMHALRKATKYRMEIKYILNLLKSSLLFIQLQHFKTIQLHYHSAKITGVIKIG